LRAKQILPLGAAARLIQANPKQERWRPARRSRVKGLTLEQRVIHFGERRIAQQRARSQAAANQRWPVRRTVEQPKHHRSAGSATARRGSDTNSEKRRAGRDPGRDEFDEVADPAAVRVLGREQVGPLMSRKWMPL